jgi:ribonuclease HI
MSAGKFYVVFQKSGDGNLIFDNWDECQRYVAGRRYISFASFKSRREAERAFGMDSLWAYRGLEEREKKQLWRKQACLPSIAVDAACSGCPGPVEYRGMLLPECVEIFRSEQHSHGTNNIGEFLGIVKGLEWLSERSFFESMSLYSDSEVAIGWVTRLGYCNTKMPSEKLCPSLRIELASADEWLNSHKHFINLQKVIKKWDTEMWGEIPADYGRK